MPAAHYADGLAQAAQIQPRNAAGQPSANGRIGVVAIGMSNSANTFDKLDELLTGLCASNVVLVNAAQGMMDAAIWADPNSSAWGTALQRVASAGLTSNQVQVVLNYHAVAHIQTPPQPWPKTPQDLQAFSEGIAGNILAKFPQTRITFWGTREYGGYSTSQNNPEPYAYRSGFGVKWMIEKQISGHADLNFDPGRGPVKAAWMAWGPYTWADGMSPRADGLIWECRDFASDGTHPRHRGRAKLAGPWAALLRTSPLTAPWFNPPGNLSPLVTLAFPQGNSTLTSDRPIALEAHAQDDDGAVQRVKFRVGGALLGEDANAPWSQLWQPPGAGDYSLSAVAYDNLGLARTSAAVVVKILAPTNLDSTTLASDSFESTDFLGGGGWNQSAWIIAGSPWTTNNGMASDGEWHAVLPSAATLSRSLNLPTPDTARLEFAWRGALPAGTALVVEVNDGSWRPAFNSGSITQLSFQAVPLPLEAYAAASNFGVRFRVTGSGGQAALDDIKINSVSTTTNAASLQLKAARLGPQGFGFSWSGQASGTYLIHQSSDLTEWQLLHETTTEDDGALAWLDLARTPHRFFRVERLSP